LVDIESLTAKPGRESSERVVGPQAILDAASERCVARRVAL